MLLGLAVPVAFWTLRFSLAGLDRRRRLLAVTARVAMLLLLTAAAAGLRLRIGSDELTVLFLVDLSASISPEGRTAALEFVERAAATAGRNDRLGVVVFARDASVEVPVREGSLGGRLDRIASVVRTDATDIAGALRLASGLVPDGTTGRIILLSDGNESRGDALDEARRLRARGISVSTVTLATGGRPEVAVTSLRVPEAPARGETFDVRVEVASTRDTTARLRIYRNNVPIGERDVDLIAGGSNAFVVAQKLDEKGFYTYRAEVEAVAVDGFAENNSREGFAHVTGEPRTLFVYGDASPSAALLRVLREAHLAPEVIVPGAMPQGLADLQHYDLVVFDNVSAETLPRPYLRNVQSWIHDLGGGFVMVGGDQSFGAGGYFKTPIAEALPVSLDVRQRKNYPELALVLAIDKSGSMQGDGPDSKIALARDGAAASVEFLADRDQVAVLAFDDGIEVVVPLAPLGGRSEQVRTAISTIGGGGGTEIYPALRHAYEMIRESNAPLKHVLLLSDGQSAGGDYTTLVRSMRADKITLSTVAIGADADADLMEYLASEGGGRFYAALDVRTLPQIFTKEAFLAARMTIVEEPTTVSPLQPARATSGIDWRSAPQLGGYVGSSPRETAVTGLISHRGEPVFASWQYGLGRSLAFTSDSGGRWAAPWLGWDGFATFWTQALREVVRRESGELMTPSIRIDGDIGRIVVDALTERGSYANDQQMMARVVDRSGQIQELPLAQTAPGRYEGEFEAGEEGAYLVSILRAGTPPGLRVTGATRPYSSEFSLRDSDEEALRRIAQASNGVASVAPETVFTERGWASRPREIWPWLLATALVLLPFDIAIRRLRLGRSDAKAVMVRVRRSARVLLPPRQPEAAAAAAPGAPMSALKARKRRAVVTVKGAGASRKDDQADSS
jgi:Mg-chelatase subunit ChlD